MCSGHQHFCGQAGQGGTADEKFPQALDRQGSSSTVCRSRQAQQMPPAASHVPGLGRSPWPRLRPGVLTRLNIRARSGPPACSRGCRITPQAPSSADAPGVRSPAGRPARQTAARSARTAGGSSRWSSRVMRGHELPQVPVEVQPASHRPISLSLGLRARSTRVRHSVRVRKVRRVERPPPHARGHQGLRTVAPTLDLQLTPSPRIQPGRRRAHTFSTALEALTRTRAYHRGSIWSVAGSAGLAIIRRSRSASRTVSPKPHHSTASRSDSPAASDIPCSAFPARRSVAAMAASRSPNAASTSTASSSSRRSRPAHSLRRAACTPTAARHAACLTNCWSIEHPLV